MSLIDLLLVDVELADAGTGGTYDEGRSYTVLGDEALVTLPCGREATETKVAREPPDRELWGATETRVGGEDRDHETWATTTTMTQISHESNDRDR